MSILEVARGYAGRGWSVVPIPYREKNPGFDGWQQLRLTEADLPKHFNGKPQNIGVLLGEPSGGLVDIDLDCVEAVQLAPHFLPDTLRFGREGKAGSHFIYQLEEPLRTQKYFFRDGGRGEMIVELRSTGTQTVFPGSTHESGEPIRFENERPPARIVSHELAHRVRLLAVASLLLRAWPRTSGTRHDTALAAAGALLRAGVKPDEAARLLRAVASAAGDPEAEDRVRTVDTTVARLRSAGDASGWPTLAEFLGETIVRYARKWLGVPSSHGDPGSNEAGGRPEDTITELPALEWQPFPVDVLPRSVAEYVRAQAAAIGCDPAFVAMPAFAVLAAAVGNSIRVQIKRSWHEPATLWVLVVAPSGSAKSPALDAALRPVYALERESAERHREQMTAYEEAVATYKDMPKEERLDAEKPERPKRRRFRVADTTIESLALVHGDNPRGLLLARDELAGWLGSFDRYARGEADMQSWIEMHGGRPLTIDRKSSQVPVLHLERPAVCVAGTVQPRILAERLGPQHFTSGFASRLLMAMPPVGKRGWTEADVAPELQDAYNSCVRRLYAFPMPENPEEGVLELSAEAKALFCAFVNENGERMHRIADGNLRSALAKLEATAARLALVLHLAHHVDGFAGNATPGPISASAMGRGLSLARWLRRETARMYEYLGFEERGQSPDERILSEVPDVFGWQNVAEIAKVKRRAAFKIIHRLETAGLAYKIRHGEYEKSSRALCTLDTLDTIGGDGTTLQSVQSAQNVQSAQCMADNDGPAAEVPVEFIFANPLPHDHDDG